jgi:hypothetical protein
MPILSAGALINSRLLQLLVDARDWAPHEYGELGVVRTRRGRIGWAMVGFTAFAVATVAPTLLILPATGLLTEGRGIGAATQNGSACTWFTTWRRR